MKYPYEAFLLSPAMVIKPVIVEGQYGYSSSWLKIKGKVTTVYRDRVFRSKGEAIYAAEKQLENARNRLATGNRNLAKKEATLAKMKAAKLEHL